MFRFLDFFRSPFDSNVVSVHVNETYTTKRHGDISTIAPSNTAWVDGVVDVVIRNRILKFLPSREYRYTILFLDAWIVQDVAIHTDFLSSYQLLSSLDYLHHIVNHFRTLVSQDEIHTNHIAGLFGSVKRLIRDYMFRAINTRNFNYSSAIGVLDIITEHWTKKEL